jgi:hypothetical protein
LRSLAFAGLNVRFFRNRAWMSATADVYAAPDLRRHAARRAHRGRIVDGNATGGQIVEALAVNYARH